MVGLLGSGLLSAGSAAALAPESVNIGVMGDLTGENAGLVMPILNGVRLAVDRYNATGPRDRITVKVYDSQASPERAVALTKRAIRPEPPGVPLTKERPRHPPNGHSKRAAPFANGGIGAALAPYERSVGLARL